MLDGDNRGVARRIAELEGACEEQDCAPRKPDEGAMVFVPTCNIETWLAYLDGKPVDETKHDYPRLARPRECRRHVDRLVEMCQSQQLREPAPPSLAAACTEYRRWSAAL